jgi:hypothetical protein
MINAECRKSLAIRAEKAAPSMQNAEMQNAERLLGCCAR